jgi:formate hydrogenlyase transcriptional activator
VFPIEIPPLRERPEDIPMLAWAFAAEFGRAMNKTIETIPQSAMEALQRYPWPGNIRELRNIIERGVIVTTGPALKVVLPQGPASPSVRTAPTNLQELERQHILEVLRQSRWRVRGAAGAAEMLGLKPTTLEARMAKLGISRTSARQAP